MKIIGVTGPSGSGKSLLCQRLSKKGFSVIDADDVYHKLLIPPSDCIDALRGAFGNTVFKEDGTLDRKALSEIVFHDEEKLNLLNTTVHGFVLDKIRKMISELERIKPDIVHLHNIHGHDCNLEMLFDYFIKFSFPSVINIKSISSLYCGNFSTV